MSVVLVVVMILCLTTCAQPPHNPPCENCGKEAVERALFSNEKIDKESHWICPEEYQIEFAKKNSFNSWHAVEQ